MFMLSKNDFSRFSQKILLFSKNSFMIFSTLHSIRKVIHFCCQAAYSPKKCFSCRCQKTAFRRFFFLEKHYFFGKKKQVNKKMFGISIVIKKSLVQRVHQKSDIPEYRRPTLFTTQQLGCCATCKGSSGRLAPKMNITFLLSQIRH